MQNAQLGDGIFAWSFTTKGPCSAWSLSLGRVPLMVTSRCGSVALRGHLTHALPHFFCLLVLHSRRCHWVGPTVLGSIVVFCSPVVVSLRSRSRVFPAALFYVVSSAGLVNLLSWSRLCSEAAIDIHLQYLRRPPPHSYDRFGRDKPKATSLGKGGPKLSCAFLSPVLLHLGF